MPTACAAANSGPDRAAAQAGSVTASVPTASISRGNRACAPSGEWMSANAIASRSRAAGSGVMPAACRASANSRRPDALASRVVRSRSSNCAAAAAAPPAWPSAATAQPASRTIAGHSDDRSVRAASESPRRVSCTVVRHRSPRSDQGTM